MEKKLLLSFPPEATFQSFAYELVKDYDLRINILKAEIEIGKGGKLLMAIEAPEENIERGIQYMKSHGIQVSSLANKVFYDNSRCINCGSCASSCPSGALSITAPDWKLKFDAEKCIVCKLCLKSCPMKLFSIEFTE